VFKPAERVIRLGTARVTQMRRIPTDRFLPAGAVVPSRRPPVQIVRAHAVLTNLRAPLISSSLCNPEATCLWASLSYKRGNLFIRL
jgi:hypothetical protein